MGSLEDLADRNVMTKTAAIKNAIRFYPLLERRLPKGERLFVEGEAHQVRAELLLV